MAFFPTVCKHETGERLQDNDIPDGIPVMTRVETYRVFCSGGDAAYRPGLFCCADWKHEQNVGDPHITTGQLTKMLLDSSWRTSSKDGLWLCPECAKFNAKKKRR